jgi:hypothetical protein
VDISQWAPGIFAFETTAGDTYRVHPRP